ncbi:hypothetical protein KFK09_020387 [Dendrobium nobile]|uniref:Reverse transcriptase domain-containing protein n=1 Tax=Dendrobium nobile TaxID=94219 RepID=A0A8T3ASU2_DENNO|nr:hypothetical protein KFK09_020387 [Dendrobium nobile]
MCPSWKDTMVILIPKTDNAAAPNQFRPISLCQSLYKVVAKILVNRLKPVLSGLIGEAQGAFVPGRLIANHGLLAQEMMCKFQHSTMQSGLMALKVDMEQAYDCMSWDTLRRTMEAMGFSGKFIHWVTECVCEPRFAFMLNGNRSQWINAHSGLRQGCPLSPYLFILCSELLTKAFNQSGAGLGVQIVPTGERVSHLLYADDILVFAEASVPNAKRISGLLTDYCGWTGQNININKSAILFNKSCPRWKCRRIARLLGYNMVSSLEYLGLPLLTRRTVKADFAKTVNNAMAKVNIWGKRHLSLAGSATLIRTSLLSVPMYHMTLTLIPKGCLELIEKVGRQFLWGKTPNSRGLHYVSWSELCKPMALGGLGFHSALDWMGPLRAQLALNFIQQPTALLHRVLREKYGNNPWTEWPGRNVSNAWKIMNDGANALRPIIRWKIGDGKTVNILSDTWIMDRRLDSWPAFGDLRPLENCQVSHLLTAAGDWDENSVRDYFGEVMAMRILAIPTNPSGGEDLPELINQRSGRTITSLAYSAHLGGTAYPFRWLKKFKLHPRESLFWWRLLRDAIPTNVWLVRRNLENNRRCPWGCSDDEDREHCTIRCSFLKTILTQLGRWGFSMPSSNSFVELLRNLEHLAGVNPSLGRIFCSAVYQAWRARNDKKHGRSWGSPSVLAATTLGSLSKPHLTPALEQCHINQPPGLFDNSAWCVPPPSWLKFNFDASVLPSNLAGLGVVVRDHLGNLIVASGQQIEHWDAATAELLAASTIKDIIEDWMFDRPGIIIEGDCSNIIEWLQQLRHPHHRLHRARDGPDFSFLAHFHQVLFMKVPRMSNMAADFCASKALEGNFVWKDVWCNDIPDTFLSLLREESARG